MTPLPCQLCKQAPETGEGRLATCETETCAFFDVVVHLETWNALQTALIELQREAFEAGAEYVNTRALEVQDQVGIWIIRPAFDLYLAERSKS